MRLFEVLAAAIVVATLGIMARTRPSAALLIDYAGLALAGWLGEQSCITAYGFYRYAPVWDAMLGDVPALVPLIWPLVVLSARDVVRCLAPGLGLVRHAAMVGAIVAFDASLVEVIAVRAGLWGWAEPGHLGVPLVGALGWGYFAFGATVVPRAPWNLASGPALAHAGIVGSWWLVFRWTARGELGWGGFGPLAVASLTGALFAISARRRGRAMPPAVWGPRVLAAALFVALLVATEPSSAPLWLHAALVAAPYLVVTGLGA